MQDDFQQSRFNQRSKRRKTNLILNGLIGIVLVLIIVVSGVIFLGNDDKATTQKEQEQSLEASNEVNEGEESSNEETAGSDSETNEDSSSTDSSSSNEESSEEASSNDNEEAIVTEGGADSNVVKTIVNPNWEPVGTSQTGEHTSVYSGVDWDEMVSAIEYATGLSKDNMTIKFLGNDGHNKSKGTVFSKDRTQIYRVSIEWVEGKGWKPTLVEELALIE
ncbi:YrrS family protein [Robertmurraya korlensis]|uniref:YrrS family protein n=1 Tax=Robertmurraya korlensis TaxID=519977 RepID=UPI0027BB166E|nr:YrrS family protein [Robertmurraya korlensis]